MPGTKQKGGRMNFCKDCVHSVTIVDRRTGLRTESSVNTVPIGGMSCDRRRHVATGWYITCVDARIDKEHPQYIGKGKPCGRLGEMWKGKE